MRVLPLTLKWLHILWWVCPDRLCLHAHLTLLSDLQLWGTHLVFKNLEKKRPDPNLFENTLPTRSGGSGITGNPGLLAESAMFGTEVAKCYASVLSTAGF